jgi:hypothetical protein
MPVVAARCENLVNDRCGLPLGGSIKDLFTIMLQESG